MSSENKEVKMPDEWLEVRSLIMSIGKKLRNDATMQKERALNDYREMLNKMTGAYIYFIPQFKKYRAAKSNNETAKYVNIMLEHSSTGKKFVSKAAEIESSESVANLRLIRDWLDGQVLAAEQGIRTIKKQMDIYVQEKLFQKNSE